MIWEGEPAIQSTLVNITERKEAEQKTKETMAQLDETQMQLIVTGKLAVMGQLAAGIAHEINNPLASIASSAEMLSQIAACEVANRPGRLEPRVLKRRRHGYKLMQEPRSVLRAKLQNA